MESWLYFGVPIIYFFCGQHSFLLNWISWFTVSASSACWFSAPNPHFKVLQLPPSHPPNCLIRLDVGALIMTAAAVLQSGGNYPLIASLLTFVCYFGAALARQTISKKQRVYCRLISTECGCQMAPQQRRIRATWAFVGCFWWDNCEISAMSLFVGLEVAASKLTFLIPQQCFQWS